MLCFKTSIMLSFLKQVNKDNTILWSVHWTSEKEDFRIVVTSSHARNIDFELSSAATFQSPPPASQHESDPGRRVSDLITTGYF